MYGNFFSLVNFCCSEIKRLVIFEPYSTVESPVITWCSTRSSMVSVSPSLVKMAVPARPLPACS